MGRISFSRKERDIERIERSADWASHEPETTEFEFRNVRILLPKEERKFHFHGHSQQSGGKGLHRKVFGAKR